MSIPPSATPPKPPSTTPATYATYALPPCTLGAILGHWVKRALKVLCATLRRRLEEAGQWPARRVGAEREAASQWAEADASRAEARELPSRNAHLPNGSGGGLTDAGR